MVETGKTQTMNQRGMGAGRQGRTRERENERERIFVHCSLCSAPGGVETEKSAKGSAKDGWSVCWEAGRDRPIGRHQTDRWTMDSKGEEHLYIVNYFIENIEQPRFICLN